MSDRKRLEEIKDRHNQAPSRWKADFDGDQYTICAIPPFTANAETAMHEEYFSLKEADFEAMQLILNAHEDIGFLLNLVERSIKKVKELNGQNGPAPKEEKPKNYATNAAMSAKDPAFKKFLKDRHGLGNATDENTHQKIREMCGVASVNELNIKPEKTKIWLKLLGEFNDFQRTSSQQSGAR